MALLRSYQRMANQHHTGQWTKTAGDGCEERSDFAHGCKIHVAYDRAIDRIDTCIQHDCAGLDHISGDAVRTANADHQDIRAACNAGQIPRVRVTDCHCRVLAQEYQPDWLAANITAPDDDRVSA